MKSWKRVGAWRYSIVGFSMLLSEFTLSIAIGTSLISYASLDNSLLDTGATCSMPLGPWIIHTATMHTTETIVRVRLIIPMPLDEGKKFSELIDALV